MSGRGGQNDSQNQGTERSQGQQPPQGGRQPQQGQPAQGQGQRPPQQAGRQQQPAPGGGHPPSRGSPANVLTEPEPKRYLVGIVGTLAVLAVAVFLMVALLGAVGGPELTSKQIQDASGEQRQQLQDQRQTFYKATLVSTAMSVAPYVALGLVALAGILVGTRLQRPRNDVLLTAGASAFLGAFVFVFLVVFLTSTQLPSAEDLGGSTAQLFGTSLKFGQLIINSVLMGVAGGVAGVGGAFFGDRL